MTNFVPIFPLAVVVYPGEQLNLHVFEPRYVQLIRECLARGKPFGIPTLIDNKLQDYGTLMEIQSVKEEYPDGEMDIVTRGIRVFRVLEVIKEVPAKLYSGAIVHYPRNYAAGNPELMKRILAGVYKLHQLMQVVRPLNKPGHSLGSFDVAHLSGLTLAEEYEMLCLFHERQRQEYLRRHLEKVLPIADGLDRLRKRAKLNGHFRIPGTHGDIK